MNTTRDVLPGSDIRRPSGCEVESASFYEPIGTEITRPQQQPGLREKAEELKTRGIAKVHDVQRVVRNRGMELKRSLISAKEQGRTQLQRNMTTMQSSMRNSPMKWAGIAAGSGVALGLIGRMAHWRRHHHQKMRAPDLVIIDATC